MNLHLKQRIVGIAVLLILIALLIPLLFTGSKKIAEKSELKAAIPALPPPPLIQQINAEKKLQAWEIQLASFSNENNANTLVKKLTNKGFTAYIKKIKTTKKGYEYQVFVGPEVSREKAENLLEELQKTFQLKGLVTRYTL